MFPLQVLISICKRKSLTSSTSQQHLLYVNKLTEVIKQTVSGNLITSHWDLGKGLGILDSFPWHWRLLEATIHLERTFLIGVFLPSKKNQSSKNQLKTFQIWFFAVGEEEVKQRPGGGVRKKKPNNKECEMICFHPFVWSILGMTGAYEVILQVISGHLIFQIPGQWLTFQAGMIRLL